MLRFLMRGLTRIVRSIARAVTAFADHIAHRLRRAWTLHGQWVATDAVYAAVTATVLAGPLGLVPVTDVVSAVLLAVFGVHMSHRHPQQRDTTRWSEDWDLA